ncbi:MAG: hypothetical protein GY950_15030 [bacterium]|nr:hypothetical protein [bacterium]
MKEHKVKYLVIGGIAAVLYGVPRATFDLDILIEATPQNVQKLLDALLQAGLFTASQTSISEVLATEVTVFKVGENFWEWQPVHFLGEANEINGMGTEHRGGLFYCSFIGGYFGTGLCSKWRKGK